MKTKKITKVLIALLVAVTLIATFSQVALATTEIDFNDMQEVGADNNSISKVYNIIGPIIDIARIIGAGVAVIMLIVLGIQYVAASPEGKAEIKKKLTPYILGVVLIFAAVAILSIIKSWASGLN